MVTVILKGKLEEMTAQAAAEKVRNYSTLRCESLGPQLIGGVL